jgi:hypothetical protein
MHWRFVFAGVLALGLHCLAAIRAAGAEEAPIQAAPATPIPAAEAAPRLDLSARTLNGHTFFPSQLVPWPFVTTHFGNLTGVSYSGFTRPGQDENGHAVLQSMSLGTFSEGFELGIGFTDFFALHLNVGGQVMAGSTTTSALNLGAVFAYETSGGVLFRLLRFRELFQLGVGLEIDYMSGKRMEPLDILSFNSQGMLVVDRSKLLSDVQSFSLAPSLRFAIAPTSFLGVQGGLTTGYQHSNVAGTATSNAVVLFAAALTLDLSPASVPLGFLVGYGLEHPFVDGAETTQSVEGGIFYTGRRNLTLGLASMTRFGPGDSKEYTGLIRLFYVW